MTDTHNTLCELLHTGIETIKRLDAALTRPVPDPHAAAFEALRGSLRAYEDTLVIAASRYLRYAGATLELANTLKASA